MNNLITFIRTGYISDETWLLFRIVAWYCVNRRIALPAGRCHFFEILFLYTPAYIALGLIFRSFRELFRIVKFFTWPLWKPVAIVVARFIKQLDASAQNKPNGFKLSGVIFGVLCGLIWLMAIVALPSHGGKNESGVDDWDTIDYLTSFGGSALTILITYVGFYCTRWVWDDHKSQLRDFFMVGNEASKAISLRAILMRAAVEAITLVPKGASAGAQLAVAGSVAFSDLWRKKLCQRITYGIDTTAYESSVETTR